MYIKKEKAYLYIFYTVFTDNAIEVCIKKFVHFLRKGFIKIITNISCLKLGEKRLKDKKHTAGRLTYLMPNMTNSSYRWGREELPLESPLIGSRLSVCSYHGNWNRSSWKHRMWY